MSSVAVRRLSLPSDLGLIVGGALLCLAVARVLPGRLETLSHARLVVVPGALLLLLVVGWLSIARPLAAFGLAFALLGVVRVQPAPVDAVFALLIAATLATAHLRPRVPPVVVIPLLCYVLVSLLSMTNAISLTRAVTFEATTLYLIMLAVWLSWAFIDPIRVQLAIKIYVIVAAVSGALGPLALYLPLPSKHLFLYGGARAEGLFKDPNVYSAFLVPAAVILLDELTTPRILSRWRRSVVATMFALVSIGIVVAYSRAAWLNLAIAVSVLIAVQTFRSGGLRRSLKSIGLLLMSGFIGFLVLLVTGSLSFLQERSHLESYDTQRFANQHSAFSDMVQHVFGYGPGQTEVLLPLATHSTYVRVAFEQGLLGLSALLLILAGTLVCACLLARRRVEVNGVGTAALLGIWLGQIANSFFIDTLHWRHIWIMAALIWCGYSTARRLPASGAHAPPVIA